MSNSRFGWTVTPPSPWLDVLTVEITGSAVADSSPLDNAATKSLLMGSGGWGGDEDDREGRVIIEKPDPGDNWTVGDSQTAPASSASGFSSTTTTSRWPAGLGATTSPWR